MVKTAVGIFIVAFLTLFIWGYYGGKSLLSNPHAIEKRIASNVKVNYLSTNLKIHHGNVKFDAKVDYESMNLRYHCPDYFYAYSIKKDEVGRSDHKIVGALGPDGVMIPLAEIHRSEIMAAFSILTIHDVVYFLKSDSSLKRKSRVAIGAIIGAFSGYALGRWVAISDSIECDHPRMIKILGAKDSTDSWKRISRLKFHGMARLLKERAKVKHVDPDTITKLTRIVHNSSLSTFRPTAKDYTNLHILVYRLKIEEQGIFY